MQHIPGIPITLAKSFVALAAHTGTTNETVLWTYAMPAGLMGASGTLRIRSFFSAITSSANAKTIRHRMGATGNGIAGTIMGTAAWTTVTQGSLETLIANRNVANSQLCWSQTQRGADQLLTTMTIVTASRDTTAIADIVVTAQLASSGETLTPDGYIIELTRGA